METGEVNHKTTQDQINLQQLKESYSSDVVNKLTEFFSILLQIDKREKVTKSYDK
jgi:hypothetical protein